MTAARTVSYKCTAQRRTAGKSVIDLQESMSHKSTVVALHQSTSWTRKEWEKEEHRIRMCSFSIGPVFLDSKVTALGQTLAGTWALLESEELTVSCL